jgi:hypothetical protein
MRCHRLLLVSVVLLVTLTVRSSPPPSCCTLLAVDPTTNTDQCCTSSCSCWSYGGGSGRGVKALRGVRTISLQFNKQLPCRFDCTMFNRISTSAPLFDSCTDPIISYNGDHFTNSTTGEIEYRCFSPRTWNSYISSPGKLSQVVQLCQEKGCLRSGDESLFNSTTMPEWSDLIATTTLPMYYWYGQYKTMYPSLGLVRCPNALTNPFEPLEEACPTSSPVEFFSTASTMQSQSDTQISCSGSDFCEEFSGLNTTTVPVPIDDSSTYELRKELLMDLELSAVVSIRLDCIDPSVNVTNVCV